MESRFFGEYAALVAEAGAFHGDVCVGIALGTRMTMSGLRRIGIEDPRGADQKRLMVFVEIDRCPTDAIMALTGCTPGKRTLKIHDYGKMAATFLNLESGRAVRVAVRGDRSPAADNGRAQPDFAGAAEEELFCIDDVEVPLHPGDLPGKPLHRAVCACCGEVVMDGREIESRGDFLCKPCFDMTGYYRIVA